MTWRSLFALLLGSSLPAYLYDGSATKLWIAALILGSLVGLILSSGIRLPGLRSSINDWAIVAFIASYLLAVGVTWLTQRNAPSANYWYPVLFVSLVFLNTQIPRQLVIGAYISLLGIVLIGWYRFLSGSGGEEAEHLLGYWGVKYTAATRNNDVLAPMLLTMLSVLAIGWHRHRSNTLRLIIVTSFVTALLAVLLSYSRSAWLSLLAFACVYVFAKVSDRPAYRTVAVFIPVGLIAAVIIPSLSEIAEIDYWALWERFSSIHDARLDSSNQERWQLIKYSFWLGMDHPLLGAGAGRFTCCLAEYGSMSIGHALHPENLFAHVHAEMGLLAAGTLAAGLFGMSLRGMRSPITQHRAASAMLVALIIWLQFNSELLSLAVWILLGLTVRLTAAPCVSATSSTSLLRGRQTIASV